MKRILFGLLLLSSIARADTFATLPNESGGKIVLTDEACKDNNGRVYEKLRRAYNYGASGTTGEGCWTLEDETILVYWLDSDRKMRYPAGNFTLAPKYKKSNSGSNGYKY